MLELGCGSAGVVSGLPAEAQVFGLHSVCGTLLLAETVSASQ